MDYVEAINAVAAEVNKGNIAHSQGYMTKAVELWGLADDMQRGLALQFGIPTNPRLLLEEDWNRNFGHTTHLAIWAKASILGMADDTFALLVDEAYNPVLLDCFRPLFKVFPRKDFAYECRLAADRCATLRIGGKHVWFVDVCAMTEKRWRAEGRGPLITLPAEFIKKGWERLGPGWFVVVHARNYRDSQDGRDGNIANYEPAMKMIEAKGGRCISIPTGDVAFDTWLCSQARFVISGNSGPAWVTGILGTPLLGADWHPWGIPFPYSGSKLLHKKMRLASTGRFLDIEECNTEPWNHLMSTASLRGLGIDLIDSWPEEVLDGAETMLAWTDK